MSYAPTGPPMPPNMRGYPAAAVAAQAQAIQAQQQAAYAAQAQAQAQAQAAAAHYRGAPAQVPGGPARRGPPMMPTPGMPMPPAAAPQPVGGMGMLPVQPNPHPGSGLPPNMPSAATGPGGVPLPGGAPPNMPNAVPAHMLTSQRTHLTPAEYAARRARKPTSRIVPPGVADVIIGDGVEEYKKLREVERRLDGVMVKKRLDLGDGLAGRGGGGKRNGKLRVWISQEIVQNATGDVANGRRVKIKVEGRVLDYRGRPIEEVDFDESDDEDSDKDESDEQIPSESEPSKQQEKQPATRPRLKFSDFIRSLTVEFQQPPSSPPQGAYADTTPATWQKPIFPPNLMSSSNPNAPQPPPPANTDFDSITFTRATTVNLNATLRLTRDEPDPEQQRYKLTPELAYILGTTEDTRGNALVGLYEYIRALNLQESEERRSVRCDEPLKRLFGGREKIYFNMIPDAVAVHTLTPDPVRIPFTVRIDTDKVEDTVYDVAVSLPAGYDPLTATLNKILTNPEYPAQLRAINALDDQLALIIQALGHSKAKHGFLTGYAEDPAGFVRRWLSSQKRDLSIILGEGENGEGILPLDDERVAPALAPEFRRGGENGVWDTPVAREAVRYMLAKPVRGR